MTQTIELADEITEDLHGERLDKALAIIFPDYSRSQLKSWIEKGLVTVDDTPVTVAKTPVLVGQEVTVSAEVQDDGYFQAEDIPLKVIFEDEYLMIIDKPAGLTVHPGAGCRSGTLMNGILFRYPESRKLPRAGIVHRLDKDTSGLMVVAKTIPAVHRLVKMISRHDVVREYEAVVSGHMTAGGTVDEPIGRSSQNRIMMAVKPEGLGKEAVTHYRIMEKFRAHTRLRLRLETGRTHQIRVHMAHIRHPLVGDPLYAGKRSRQISGASEEFTRYVSTFPRQALHAVILEFEHPFTGEQMSFSSEISADIAELLAVLRKDTLEHPEDIVW
ncbi:23S rRNA pseudouridine(1911/1915/1917) synthase RluD [Succinimonas amylolytica]|uniref:23S rRNA pseudouridine(1911/1915/1917) synthase RluD n=1 Tax=Succinimonas amylolytica TaxID=83769 RepID=UPI0003667E1B|nr:23S rRNA pseudouridine(1911/1915/1917) synthase RluD [Succinimonas amylolytica]